MEYFSIVVVSIMVFFGLIAIIDTVFLKNRLGLGPEFRRAFDLVGPTMLGITGIISFVPVIAWVLERTITPLYQMMGLDPSLAVSTIIANDMGGFQLAKAVAIDPIIGEWAGMVYGSMMGATIVFSIPVGLAAIDKKDLPFFSKGVLFGISAIPIGTFVGGLMMGIPVTTVLLNLIIPIIISIIIILCIYFLPKGTIKVFKGFSIFIDAFAIIALGFAIVKDCVLVPIANTGAFNIDDVAFFRLIAPTGDGIAVAGSICMVLCGTLPFVYCLTKALKKPLNKLAAKIGFSELGIASFITSSANSLGMYPNVKDMKDREKILNISFAVCAAWVIGDHLAFCAGNAPHLIAPMMVAKLISGITAVLIAALFTRKMKNKQKNFNTQPMEESVNE